MKQTLATLLAVAAVLLTGTVFAAGPCVWAAEGIDNPNVTTQEGTTVVVVVTDNNSTLTAPSGWTTKWEPTGCFGRDPKTCGTSTATMAMDEPGTFTAHFSLPKGACSGPLTWDVTIKVEAAPAATAASEPKEEGELWTAEEKDEVVDHARSPHAAANNGQSVQGSVGLLWAPNLNTTTRDTWGVEGAFGALVTPHLRLGGALRYATTGIPVEQRLNPVTWQVTETQYVGAFRITGVLTPARWVAIDLGGQVGALVLHYPAAYIRQLPDGRVENVLEETQVTPIAGILGAVSFYPGSSGLIIGLQAGVDLTLTDVRRRVGAGYGGTGLADEDANQKPYAFPAFGLVIGGRF